MEGGGGIPRSPVPSAGWGGSGGQQQPAWGHIALMWRPGQGVHTSNATHSAVSGRPGAMAAVALLPKAPC